MCKALSDIKKKAKKEGKAEGIAEGKAEGIAEGIVEGEENAIKKVILTLLEMSYKLVDICTITGATEAKVREVAVEANFTI